MTTVLTRIKQPLRLIRQVIQQVGAEYESTGTIDANNLVELVEIEKESEQTYLRIKQVREQVELNLQYREDSSHALPVIEDRVRNLETVIDNLPILLATDDDNMDEFLQWICEAPEYLLNSLIRAKSDIFECIKKTVTHAESKR